MVHNILLLPSALLLVTVTRAETFTTLVNLAGGTSAAQPGFNALVQGINGDFYGASIAGGNTSAKYGAGTIYSVSPQGVLKILHAFDGKDGARPTGLMVMPDGTLYGTATHGGAANWGSVFSITPAGTFKTLHYFDSVDGANPKAPPVLGFDGLLYGTAYSGGFSNYGTIYQITTGGTFGLLYALDGGFSYNPEAALIQASDGLLYGVTSLPGSIFSISTSGVFSQLYSYSNFAYLVAALVQDTDGNFYGTTKQGGTNNNGTAFEFTPGGAPTVLYNFYGTAGDLPEGALIQGTDGNFYGTTAAGGTRSQSGTVFQITPGGTLTTLHSFNGIDGNTPYAGLVQGTDGNFYGTTGSGGSRNVGTIFRLSMGLGPFVRPLPVFGSPGSIITILGTNLTGTTSVTFNGATAAFTVLSPTAIRATIPSGATTGKIQVVTPDGTLPSNGVFQTL